MIAEIRGEHAGDRRSRGIVVHCVEPGCFPCLRVALDDEDFFFFYEDSALSHSLLNRGVPCFILPDAAIIHAGGKSRSESSVSLFYRSKYLYLKKFYGPFHARAIGLVDRARILRKWFTYSLLSKLLGSQRLRHKQRHYHHAWNASRLK